MSDLVSHLSITTDSAEPIYQQLAAQVRRRVASGTLPPGVTVPSVRELAQALAVNKMTVHKAYGLLLAQGVLERRRGLAMVVTTHARESAPESERKALLRPVLERAALEARQLGLSDASALVLFKAVLKQTPPTEARTAHQQTDHL